MTREPSRLSADTAPSLRRHVFSVDVEDWYQGIELPMSTWDSYEQRIESSMGLLLDLMAAHGVQATCFVLGRVAEEHPGLVRRIHAEGHEVATHGYSHEKVYQLTPQRFRAELRSSIDLLQDLTGEPVLGHRAPFFSITKESLWALDILAEEGIYYDSSIFPVYNYRYGIPQADRLSSIITTEAGTRLLEVPVSTYPLSKVNWPVGGGAYLRVYPYVFLRTCLQQLEQRGEIIGMYIHPWELDPQHPRIKLPHLVSLTHYANLKSTTSKLEKLFQDFSFGSYRTLYQPVLDELTP